MTAAAIVLTGAACSGPATALPPGAEAARSFRPVSALFFLPERAPVKAHDVALVPDSKILWDLTVTATNLGLNDLKISVHGQRVFLDGSVPSAQAQQTLLEAAKRTHGVRSVGGTLKVHP